MANIRYYLRRALFLVQKLGIQSDNAWGQLALYYRSKFPSEIKKTNYGLVLSLLGFTLPKGKFIFVLDQYERLKTIQTRLQATFKIAEDLFLVSFSDITLNPTTTEEIFIIEEVFVRGVYGFAGQPMINVIDIGMNVGFASLYFAANNGVSKVYAFEPFTPTYDQALVNFRLNPEIANKIVHQNFGLGLDDEKLVIGYDYENKGQVGIYGTKLVRSRIKEKNDQMIAIRSVANVLGKLYDEHPGEPFLVKIDCEGAEYMIIECLEAGDLFKQVKLIIIEWHEKGPDLLLNILKRHGFSAFNHREPHKEIGMIYAFR